MKYLFTVAGTVTLSVEVEADSLEGAVKEAQRAGMMSLCHRCGSSQPGEWHTSGELDCDPTASELVDVLYEGAPVGCQDLESAQKEWSK